MKRKKSSAKRTFLAPLANTFLPLGVLLTLAAGMRHSGVPRDNAGRSGSTGLAAAASTVASASTALRFRVTEIPLRYSLSTDRLAINASGDVVGTYQNHEGNHRGDCAFLYQNGTVGCVGLVSAAATPRER